MLYCPPLGSVVPSSLHATVVSLPTLADIEGYERKEARVWGKISAGYPRFVRNRLVQEAAQRAAQKYLRAGEFFPVVSLKSAQALLKWAGILNAQVDQEADWVLISIPTGPAAEKLAKLIQHTGTLISSRQAEAYLKNLPRRENATATEKIKSFCAPYLAQAQVENILISLSGMNAAYAAVTAVNQIQNPKGKNLWIQLGWLYVDSAKILEKNSSTEHTLIKNIQELDKVEQILKEGRVAGVFAEAPNNPQLETPDIPKLRELCDQYDAKLILDPSAVSIATLDLLPYADIVCSSLTKYTASEGDVMAGILAVNENRPDAAQLIKEAKKIIEPLHPLDTEVLAHQIVKLEEVLQKINVSATTIAQYLSQHPSIALVRTAETVATKTNYQKLKRPGAGIGSLITVELKKEMRGVYDKLECVKGPSFGLEFTLISPYLWLAHFDEVTTDAGREEIRSAGLDPDLLRISIGLEPVEEILDMLEKALK
ncbi:MAG: PLP-dependent transferase [Opitutae bacterium]